MGSGAKEARNTVRHTKVCPEQPLHPTSAGCTGQTLYLISGLVSQRRVYEGSGPRD